LGREQVVPPLVIRFHTDGQTLDGIPVRLFVDLTGTEGGKGEFGVVRFHHDGKDLVLAVHTQFDALFLVGDEEERIVERPSVLGGRFVES
jgi:hypothetical protein